jgi:glutamate synthase domain-containing protein 1
MCGIVGLHLRNSELYPHLGALLTGMLGQLQDRGPDGAGVAIYGDPHWSPAGNVTLTLIDDSGVDPQPVLMQQLGRPVTVIQAGPTVIVTVAGVSAADLETAVRQALPQALVIGFGEHMAVLKGIGNPLALAEQFGLSSAQGWQGVGHTRMATESAVTPSGSHPYAVGPDQCMVHNGSFANHATIRRELRARGAVFDSENDTEVGARFVAQCLLDGMDVETALKELCARFDGFYTLLVSNQDSFAVVRDAIACKPAVIAETGDWVAMASEYRALVGLPGIAQARVYEPEPERVYSWTR